jgi:hypothetical protein
MQERVDTISTTDEAEKVVVDIIVKQSSVDVGQTIFDKFTNTSLLDWTSPK